MSADTPNQNLKRDLTQKTSWPIDFSILKSPPPWCANLATGVVILAVLILLFLAVVAITRLATDLLGNDAQRASDAAKSLLPIAAAVVGAALIIWRLVILNQQTQINETKTQIDRETYYTSIFAKSVELMGLIRETKSVGADGKEIARSVPNIESRLGALYSLERLLTESTRDQRAIIETLCAYIRENSPLEIPEDEAERQSFFRGDLPPRPTHRADVQAALTIIGRRPEAIRHRARSEGWRLDLRNVNLIGYDFSGLNYDNARFDSSFLNGANMSGAHFADCEFKSTFLRAAKMKSTTFHSTFFDDCDVKRAEIEATDFNSATLVDTDLRDASVTNFSIKGANLDRAFGSTFDYTLERIKNNQIMAFEALQLTNLEQFFRKAAADDRTSVSQTVHDILALMRSTKKQV
jgi:pentapeptide repeat protein